MPCAQVLLAFAVIMSLLRPVVGIAAGPLIVNDDGEPLRWSTMPVPFSPDQGSLGLLSNIDAVATVSSSFAAWAAVPTASISFASAGALPVDVTRTNWPTYLGQCDGRSPIVFDADGSITDDMLGSGASGNILGFAGPECGTNIPPVVTEGSAVLNGKFIDGISTPPANREISVAAFAAVFVHEFGHYINLDHSQVGRREAFDGIAGNEFAVATMFPFIIGVEGASLHADDQVSVSMLYPATSFASTLGRITGSIRNLDGSPFEGAYVVARRMGDPLVTAVGFASGARFVAGGSTPASSAGFYELPGLPPGSYTVEIEAIDPRFTGGSGVGPLDPPAVLPGPPEFYNGASEAGTNPPDDPTQADTVPVSAGTTQSGIDIVINQFPPPGNDECASATRISALPFSDKIDTADATATSSDPTPSCTMGLGGHSVWYTFTASSDTLLVADTYGSGYDTVLTASTDACAAPTELTCNDDAIGTASQIVFPLSAGETVLLEISSYGTSGGGTLVVHARELVCSATPLGGCHQPAVPGRARLQLRAGATHDSDRLVWKWLGGEATTKAEFGDPVDSSDYVLCLYDENADVPLPKLRAAAPGASGCGLRPCWVATKKGFRYHDAALTPSGLENVSLTEGTTGEARIIVQGNGVQLGLPGLPLAQDGAVVVQLQASGGSCWEARYSGPATVNQSTRFQDVGD